jgi:hypothetical protein
MNSSKKSLPSCAELDAVREAPRDIRVTRARIGRDRGGPLMAVEPGVGVSARVQERLPHDLAVQPRELQHHSVGVERRDQIAVEELLPVQHACEEHVVVLVDGDGRLLVVAVVEIDVGVPAVEGLAPDRGPARIDLRDP